MKIFLFLTSLILSLSATATGIYSCSLNTGDSLLINVIDQTIIIVDDTSLSGSGNSTHDTISYSGIQHHTDGGYSSLELTMPSSVLKERATAGFSFTYSVQSFSPSNGETTFTNYSGNCF